MKKVLEVFGEPIISGGQEAFVNNVVESIDWDDLSIDLFTPYYCGNSLYKSNIERRGGEVFTAGLDFNPGSSRFNIIKPLKRLLQDRKYDVVHIHSGSVSVLSIAACIAKKYKVRTVIVHAHSPAEFETLKHVLVKSVFYRTLMVCPDYYLACSLNAALCEFPKAIAMHKTKFIKNGINPGKYRFDIEKRRNIRNKLNISEDDYLIGHVGRFSREKNHEFLLQILKKLVDIDTNIKLILIGDGDLKEEIQEKSIEMHIEKHIIFTGNVENVNEYMQAIDCFLLPSLYEGLPFVGVEAQAAGMPVIVSTGVSQELKFTDSIIYEELDVDKWVNQILLFRNMKRVDNISKLKKSGFDINEISGKIRELYVES